MIFGIPAYLMGLMAIIFPIAIHLWSRKTRKTIPFGTIRFLSEDDTQAIKSLIPTEWFLLILRIMILAVLVLIMSEPFWRVTAQEKELVFMDPVYKNHPNFQVLRDSLLEHTDVRWFCPGFPQLEDSLTKSEVSHWDLLQKLENNSSKITVISPRRLSQFIGTRPQTSHVNWVSLPHDNQTFEIGNFESGLGGVHILGSSNQQFTYFSHEQDIGSSSLDSLVVLVSIAADDAFSALNQFIQVSIEAINEEGPLRIRLVDEHEAEWLIWLKDKPAPERRNLIYATKTTNQKLIDQISYRVFAMSAFDLEAFLTYNFPLQLEHILGQRSIETKAYDWRALPESQLPQYVQNAGPSSSEVNESLSRWFWGSLLLILIIERYFSLKTTNTE